MLISFAVTQKLVCVFVFAYAKSRFSHDAAQLMFNVSTAQYDCKPCHWSSRSGFRAAGIAIALECYCNYVPPTEGGGTYCFLCGSRWRRRMLWRPRSFISARYLLSRWMDFDQTCTDTLLGGRNELIRFW